MTRSGAGGDDAIDGGIAAVPAGHTRRSPTLL